MTMVTTVVAVPTMIGSNIFMPFCEIAIRLSLGDSLRGNYLEARLALPYIVVDSFVEIPDHFQSGKFYGHVRSIGKVVRGAN
jgi:hypothetical protein